MSHSHDHGSCEHEANGIDPLEMGLQYSLYQKIDLNNLECLNESEEGAAKNVFKSYENRLNFDTFVESDCDPELLFNIPFTGNIKLKGIRIIGPNDGSHPKTVRLFKNRPKMTFDDASAKADQEFELEKDLTGSIEYNTQVVKFSSVHHLTMLFPTNFGEDNTRIYYIGLRGEFSEAHHHGVTICTYESAPNMSDHKNKLFDSPFKMMKYDNEELKDKTACAGVRADLKMCLLESDCCKIQRKTPRECLNMNDGSVPNECQVLRNTFFECKRSILDNRARFRGRKGY